MAPFVGLFMAPIAAFKTQNPDCLVAIDTSKEFARLEYGEAHVAIRLGRKPDHADYVVRELGRVNLNLYAHATYIAQFGLPKTVNDLQGHRFVAPHIEDRSLPFWPWVKKHIKPEQIAISSPDIWVNVEAISQGIGIGFLAEHEVRSRPDLHRVFPHSRAWSVRMWLTTHVDLHRTEKVQAMLELIKAEFNRPQTNDD